MTKNHSILIVTPNTALADGAREYFAAHLQGSVSTEDTKLTDMNGHASKLIGRHDVVIFDADPSDASQIRELSGVLAGAGKDKIYFAMTERDVTVTEARKLRDIGVEEVLPISLERDELFGIVEESIRRRTFVREAEGSWQQQEGIVVPVMQSRGGAGSTTVAVNLACSLVGKSTLFRKSNKKKVALLDLDLQFGNANVFLDLEDNGGLLDLIESHVIPDASYLNGILQSHGTGIDVLAAPRSVVPLSALNAELVGTMLDELRHDYDAIVVDMPRAMVDWVEPVISRASRVVMVTDTAVPSVRQARRMIDFLHEEHFGLDVTLAINRESRPLLKSQHHREAEKVLGRKLEHWLPESTKICRSAADLGRPVVEMKPGSEFSKAITRLASQIAESKQNARHAQA